MRATKILLRILTTAIGIAIASPMGRTQTADAVGESLGLTRETKSLPIWEKPPSQAIEILARSIKGVQNGVMLVGQSDVGYGTAFVISKRSRLLATNAHVADIFHEAGSMLAIPNGTAEVHRVDKVWYHPGVIRKLARSLPVRSQDLKDGEVEPSSPDVAVLHVADGTDLPNELVLATQVELNDLFAQPVGMLGFPGYDTTSWPQLGQSAKATFHQGVISRLTNFNMAADVAPADLQCIQHTMASWGGFSGSPIILPNGHVVALHNMSRYVSRGGETRGIPHGVRMDCLWELLAHHGLDSQVPIGTKREALNLARFSRPLPQEDGYREAVRLVEQAGRDFVFKRFSDGSQACNKAVELAPEYAFAYLARAYCYGEYQEQQSGALSRDQRAQYLDWAMADAKKYLQMAPSDKQGAILYCICLTSREFLDTGRSANARAEAILTKLLESDGLDEKLRSTLYRQRAIARTEYGLILGDLNESLRLNLNSPLTYRSRSIYWRENGDPGRSSADELRSQELDAAVQANARAWELATASDAGRRDGAKAVEMSTQACQATGWTEWTTLDTLAAAYAETGNFDLAVRWQGKALQLAPDNEKARVRKRLRLYQSGKPFHE